MPKKKESEFEKLARLIKGEGEDIRTDVHNQIGDVRVEIGGLRKEMHEGFAAINRRPDQIIQMQLDVRRADKEVGNRCFLRPIQQRSATGEFWR
jgi:hypothetical protein